MRLSSYRSSLIAAAPLLVACASAPRTVLVDGREVPRPTLEFSGQPFRITHDRAYPNPGSPSGGLTDAGGDIHGRVCGMTVDYTVAYQGDHVQLKGRIDGPVPSEIDISEDGDTRSFEGKLGGLTVTLRLRGDALLGQVGRRIFELAPAEGDRMLGEMRDESVEVPVELNGLQALRDMPAADQGAVLPSLLTCGLGTAQAITSLIVGFGGHVSEAPSQSSSLYTRSR